MFCKSQVGSIVRECPLIMPPNDSLGVFGIAIAQRLDELLMVALR